MASGKSSPVGGATLAGTAPLVFTSAASTAQVASNITIEADWDNDGDFDETVEDITPYVMAAETVIGRDYPSSLSGRSSAGKMRLSLNNDDDRFSYFNTLSPLNADPFSLKTGRKIRVRTNDGVLGSSLITYVGIGAAAAGSNASLAPALPTGLQSAATSTTRNADLMLILASIRNSGTGTVNTPAGWANLLTSGNVTVLGRYYVDGDTAPTVTFAGGVANATTLAQCFAFRGCHQTLGHVLSLTATQLNGSAQNIATPALAVAENNNAAVIIGWKQDDWTSAATFGGSTEISDTTSVLGDDASHAIDYVIQTTASTLASNAFGITGGASAISRALLFAIRPAVDVGDPVLLARDHFTRTVDGLSLGVDELGTPWVAAANNGFGARAGVASAATGVADAKYNVNIVETIDVGTTDHYVQASVPLIVQDGRAGLIARFLDTSNYVRAYYDGALRGMVLEEVVAGVATEIAGSEFNIESWDAMTIGIGVVGQVVTVYVGGTPLEWNDGAPTYLTRAVTGTKVGLYGKWQTHSDVPPSLDDFYCWDRVRSDIDGVFWTGTIKSIRTNVKAGDLKVAELEAEGPLAVAALTEVAAPRITRVVGENENTVNHSVPAGAIVGDIMARAGILHPPHPLPANPLSNIGPHAVADGKALEMARRVELTERGFLRETQEGGVAFEDRDWRPALSSQAWFTDTPHTGQYGYSEITPLDHAGQIVNRAVARVAATAPTVVDVSNQGDDDSSLDVSIVVPDVEEGQLVLVFVACSADATNVEFGCPPPWKEHRTLRQAEGNGMRVYSLICDGTESGTTVYFYKGSTQGTYIAHIYVIDDWYGTEDGLKMGRVSTGTNAYPISPGWSRAPALYIVFQCTIGAVTGTLWGPFDTPPPIGYDYSSLEGLVFVTTPKAYETGVESVYKIDVTDTEQPRAWQGVFADYLLLETVVFAVRGYDGPLGKPTLENPKATGGSGLFTVVEDLDSQADHNAIRLNPDVPVLSYTAGDAEDWCDDVIDDFATDRPIISLMFYATKNAGLREQAMRRRVSDKVTVTADGNAGLGIEGEFHIEAISNKWSHGTRLWECRFELSPA